LKKLFSAFSNPLIEMRSQTISVPIWKGWKTPFEVMKDHPAITSRCSSTMYPSEKPVKKKDALSNTGIVPKKIKITRLSQDQLKIDKKTKPYLKEKLKIESQRLPSNLSTNVTRLSKDHIEYGTQKYHKLGRSTSTISDSTDDSTQEEFESMMVSSDRKSLSNKSPVNNVSGEMKQLMPGEIALSSASDAISRSPSSNTLSIPFCKPNMYEYPSDSRDNDSVVLSFSSNSPTASEKRSNMDLSSRESDSSSRSTRSLSRMKRAPHRKSRKKRKPKKLDRSREPYKFLTAGTPLLKLCRREPPHWRHFEVDNDLEYLIWYAGRNIKRIALDDIGEVLLGQVTPGFNKSPRSEVVHQSFSIKYKHNKYLDLICLTHRDCKMWYDSLRNLLKNIRNGCKWRRMRDIPIPQQLEKSNNAIFPAKDGKTWTKYVGYIERSGFQIRELLKRSKELSKFPCVISMRKRLKKQMIWLDARAEDTKTSEYLLMTQYDELRAVRVEIRVFQYKVAAMLREKNSKWSYLSNIFQFGNSSKSPESSSSRCSDPSSIGTEGSYSLLPINTPYFQSRRSYPGQTQSFSKRAISMERRRSWRPALVPPKWYTMIPRGKKSLIRKIMINDIINGTLRLETVTRVCSIFRVSREEVDDVAQYLNEKYKLTKINMSV